MIIVIALLGSPSEGHTTEPGGPPEHVAVIDTETIRTRARECVRH